ncbi:MAG: hypothetical protein M1836_006710 [Candelina mexicana]|nr:MAG: hypothetical protein M1836_006710 [Candelina mexicana]
MSDKLPFWLVNVPENQWPVGCPDFLLNANIKDQRILSTLDGDYHVMTWPEVTELISIHAAALQPLFNSQPHIGLNRLDQLQRVPSDLRRYLEYTTRLKKEYGSVMNFVLKKRLQWAELKPKGNAPFSEAEDIKILYNDWPYGIDSKIVHLVVWTKFDLEDDPAADDLTPKARREIDDYVNRTFGSRVNPDHVLWFKNWRSLKSIHAVEHFHVMLYNPPPEFVKEVTHGDVPLSEKVGKA